MLFDTVSGLLRVIVMALLSYTALIFVLRLAGKRSLAKLNAFDLVVTVALGSTLATIVLSKDVALMEGVLAFVMLAGLQWLISRSSVVSGDFARLVRNRPRMLLEHGVLNKAALREERVTAAEVRASVRGAGIGTLEAVAAVVLESDGSLSVIPDKTGTGSALIDVQR